MALVSCDEVEKAAINSRESLFTAALLEGLAGYGTHDCDGYAKIFDITDYVQKEVKRRSQGRQNPIFKGDALSENFAVAFYSGGQFWQRPLGVECAAAAADAQPAGKRKRAGGFFENLKEPARTRPGPSRTSSRSNGLQRARRDPPAAELGGLRTRGFHARGEPGPDLPAVALSTSTSRSGGAASGSPIPCSAFSASGLFKANGGLELYGDTNRGSVSVIVMILSAICFAGLYFTAAFFQSNGTQGPWYYRLPIPFNFKQIFFEPSFAKISQLIVLLVFFLGPLVFHVYGFQRIAKETLWEFRGGKWIERTDIQGPAHWTHYFSLHDSLMGDMYALGRRETEAQAQTPGHTRREGITYFPFWGTWTLTLAFVAWIALFFQLLVRIGALPLPWARRELEPTLASTHGGSK